MELYNIQTGLFKLTTQVEVLCFCMSVLSKRSLGIFFLWLLPNWVTEGTSPGDNRIVPVDSTPVHGQGVYWWESCPGGLHLADALTRNCSLDLIQQGLERLHS